ncbi:hypothetical protein EDB81DRAFT_230988 [Dactylonectria macrodidyma]|uniref:Uncharacterized protein n=1 Tax=Dactylonectria macrodidyma TaxID=307937 RepID=A0A9P9DMK8_9HYPO|nr:hypothetical protein EDB81DRAFT_230988 [Dactylonectria macrodidyma]
MSLWHPPMAASRLLTREHPIPAGGNWCTHCFKVALRQSREALNSAPPDGGPVELTFIECFFADRSSTRCRQCQEHGKKCSIPPVGLEGNVQDLNKLLAYVNGLIHAELLDSFVEDENGEMPVEMGDVYSHIFRRISRTRLVDLAVTLGEAFLVVNTAYRHDYGLTGPQKSAERIFNYRMYIVERHRLLAARYPAPDYYAGTVAHDR